MMMTRSGVAGLISLLVAAPVGAAPSSRSDLSYPIVDTGQTSCHDDRGREGCPAAGRPFFGQDAQYRGNRPAYRDNGDGTVSDMVTGLMWQRDFRRVSFSAAAEDAASSRVGGYDDWRVPTIKELYSLILFSGATGTARPDSRAAPRDAKPYIDTDAFTFEYPDENRYIDAQYVTSSVYKGAVMNGERAFFGVNFADGRIKAYPLNGGPGHRAWYGRWVRGGNGYGVNDLHDNGDGTVTDRATGLTWTKGDSGAPVFAKAVARTALRDGRLNWGEALAFCERLDFAGHDDWRLPNAKELQSIVDYDRSPSATGSAALSPVFEISRIAERDGRANWPYTWTGTSHYDGRRPGVFAVYVAFGEALGEVGRGGPGGAVGAPGMGAFPGGGMPGGGRPGGGMMGGFPPPPGAGMPGGFGVPGMAMPPDGMPPDGMPLDGMPGGFGRGMSGGFGGAEAVGRLIDVHGAGAQRSAPKAGDESRFTHGFGPQGDVVRINNHARCVRGGLAD